MAGPGKITVLEHFPLHEDTTIRLFNFETGIARVKPEHAALLQPLVRQLILTPISRPFVHITGMASRAGDAGANLQLSRRRAESVRELLATLGVPPARLGVFDFVGEERSNPLLQRNDEQERAVFIVITQNPLPPVRLPRPPIHDEPEALEPPRVGVPHSTLWSIKMDAAGSLGRLLGNARIARYLAKILPELRSVTRVRDALALDVAVFAIRDRSHPPLAGLYLWVAVGLSLGASIDVSGAGPWNDFETTRLVTLFNFAGPMTLQGASADLGPLSVGITLMTLEGPLVTAGAFTVPPIIPFNGGPTVGASIGKLNGVLFFMDLISVADARAQRAA